MQRRPTTLSLAVGAVVGATLLAGCGYTSGVDSVDAGQVIGWLRTEGRRVVDANGHAVRLLGVDIAMGTGDGYPGAEARLRTGCAGWRTPSAQDLDLIRKMGFNSVRLGVSWADLEPRPPRTRDGKVLHTYNALYLRDLDSVVRGLTRSGIVVFLAMQQANWSPAFRDVRTMFGRPMCQGVGMPSWLYPDPSRITRSTAELAFFRNAQGALTGYSAAWRFLAARWAHNRSVVGADMLNEPFTVSSPGETGALLANLYRKVGRAIRSANRNLLLVFQDTRWQNGGGLTLPGPPPWPNAVYSFHLYTREWRPDGFAKTAALLARAAAWNVPLWIGEFDAFGYASPGPVDPRWRGDLTAMVRFCLEHDIGITLFAFLPNSVLNASGTAPKAGLLPLFRASS